jgi:hypothetical protein
MLARTMYSTVRERALTTYSPQDSRLAIAQSIVRLHRIWHYFHTIVHDCARLSSIVLESWIDLDCDTLCDLIVAIIRKHHEEELAHHSRRQLHPWRSFTAL